jgi:peptidoglycan hydrolase-like protein with peptidoglycan-binding domain
VFDARLSQPGVNDHVERDLLVALQSALFRGDSKLEAAAVLDPAHIVQGAIGDHVRKIQLALIQLDGATITADGIYGPATAAAVLAYKQKREIINRTYQTQADNIVGKMTMASLDKEMLAAELAPVLLKPVHPPPSVPTVPPRGGVLLAFTIAGSGPTGLTPVPVRPPSTPGPPPVRQVEVIIARGTTGSIQVDHGVGGQLVRSQQIHFYGTGKNPSQVAKLLRAKVPDKDREEIDIGTDPTTANYEAQFCGETFFQARVNPPTPPQKLSDIMRLLSLVDKALTLALPQGDYSPDPRFQTGLVTKAGTPINPLPGRKINIFGEGETPGFEDYSSDIDFCSHNFSNGNGPAGVSFGHRPWTADPRKPPGIPAKSVSNICCRGSPIFQVTIDEILRIGASKCRVTYVEASGRKQSDKLRAGLKGATVIDEADALTSGHGIVFDLA